ncbi:hypothetical protein PGT21_020210 [Puccinia graminis f. sp. tritici]|uniref:CRAL-TRIO domain-containing protein n=1 Tax=Puccinia graminis f. sp. tritici TaxID=56615 RepID=A0A5B0PS68_PUCGR|nr:hypothetical protein PGT21_020210 [Puccinia graminis f. sp. tritici]
MIADQAKTKKHFPSFWNTLKHPKPHTSALPLPTSYESLTDSQRSVYQFLVDSLSSPDFELPVTTPPTGSGGARLQPLMGNELPNQGHSSSSRRLTQSEKCFCSREAIFRVCRAVKWDPHRALKRLIDTLAWRREFEVERIDYRLLSVEAETGKQFTLGYDNHQRPVLYMFPYRQNTKPSRDQIRLLVWYLERTIALMPPGVESLTLVIDFGGPDAARIKGPGSQPTPISVAKEVLKILQTYYCERLAQAICINVPWIFWGFLKLLTPFIDPKTAEKVLFDPVVSEHVPSEQLLKKGFNGTLDFQYDHEVYFKLFAELTAHRQEKMLARYARYGNGKIGMSEYVLRGGNSRMNKKEGRREQSVGTSSSTTAISRRSATSSPAVLNFGTRSASPVDDRARQLDDSDTRVRPEKEPKLSNVDRHRPPPMDLSDTSTHTSKGWCGSPNHLKNVKLAPAGERIASSRPLSPHSFSSSPSPIDQHSRHLDAINEDKKMSSTKKPSKCVFSFHSKKTSKTNRGVTTDPIPRRTLAPSYETASSAVVSRSLASAAASSSSNPQARPSLSAGARQLYQPFLDGARIGHHDHVPLGSLQADSLGSSRRIRRICS